MGWMNSDRHMPEKAEKTCWEKGRNLAVADIADRSGFGQML